MLRLGDKIIIICFCTFIMGLLLSYMIAAEQKLKNAAAVEAGQALCPHCQKPIRLTR